jgi:ferritin
MAETSQGVIFLRATIPSLPAVDPEEETMLSQRLQDALNEQMANEFYSAYLYLAMAAYFESQDLAGFAHFFDIQAREEAMHAMKFYGFINEAGGRARLLAIQEPKGEYSSPLEVFEIALEHEKGVTAAIDQLVGLAREEHSNAAEIFLQWFVTEQVEEENTFTLCVSQLKMIEGNPQGMLFLDKEMGARPMPAEPA